MSTQQSSSSKMSPSLDTSHLKVKFPFKAKYGNYVNGKFVEPKSGKYFDNTTPITNEVICQVPRSNEKDIDFALDAAHAAFPAWGKTSITERSNILNKIAECSALLSDAHVDSVNQISNRIKNPDLTPSAQMLNEMKHEEKGFFEYTDQFSHKYQKLYQNMKINDGYFSELDKLRTLSFEKQREIESDDKVSFDQFLEEYFSSDI